MTRRVLTKLQTESVFGVVHSDVYRQDVTTNDQELTILTPFSSFWACKQRL